MERLNFGQESQYNAIELVIHLSRYLSVRNLCQGLNVLDVACGEGYGSYAMASFWGAKSVTGVDISEEAVRAAQNVFSHPSVKYMAAPAESIDEIFAPESFDLVVSLETIEHVNDPEKFLSAIKKVLKPGGIVVVSCPNDHWLYGPGETENPFHLRTYYFHEFKEQAEKLLGKASCYLFGRPVNGFGNFLLESDDSSAITNKNMANQLKNTNEISVSRVGTNQSLSPEDSLYFVGFWGDLPVKKEELTNCAYFPISMNRFSITLEDLHPRLLDVEKWAGELQTALHNGETRILELEGWTGELQTALHNAENRALELEKQNIELQATLTRLQEELAKSYDNQPKSEQNFADPAKTNAAPESGFSKVKSLLGKFKNASPSDKE